MSSDTFQLLYPLDMETRFHVFEACPGVGRVGRLGRLGRLGRIEQVVLSRQVLHPEWEFFPRGGGIPEIFLPGFEIVEN